MKFRIKVPEVEAMHFTRDRVQCVRDFLEGVDYWLAIERSMDGRCYLDIKSSNGCISVCMGDWLIKEPSGEIRVFSPEDFAKLYEPVD
jgi:hypothetical protein